MAALRFLLAGYGIAILAGIFAGAQFGSLAGWLVAWIGGAGLSVLLAYAWFLFNHSGSHVSRTFDPLSASMQGFADRRDAGGKNQSGTSVSGWWTGRDASSPRTGSRPRASGPDRATASSVRPALASDRTAR